MANKQTGVIWAELTAHCDIADLFVMFTVKNEEVQPYGVMCVFEDP